MVTLGVGFAVGFGASGSSVVFRIGLRGLGVGCGGIDHGAENRFSDFGAVWGAHATVVLRGAASSPDLGAALRPLIAPFSVGFDVIDSS